MEILEPFSVLPLPTDHCLLYKGIAFDGSFFYLTIPKICRIHQFNNNYEITKIYDVKKPYGCICYDSTSNCFWAASDKKAGVIYKLDHNLREIDFIRITPGYPNYAPMKGLSYNCEKNILVAAFSRSLLEITTEGTVQSCKTQPTGYFSSILSLAPFYVASLIKGNSQSVLVYDKDGSVLAFYQFPGIYRIEAMVFYPEKKKESSFIEIHILATKHRCYPRILKIRLENRNLKPAFSNYDLVFRCSKSPQPANDLLESIALEETALSGILNELGNKLQKSIQLANNMDDLLEINKAVNKTITNVTQLEHILYAKLETISSLCNKKQ